MAREYANGPAWMNSQKGMIAFAAATNAIFITSMGVINGGKPMNEVQKGDQIYDKNNKQNMKLDADEISTIGFIIDRVITMGGFSNVFAQETQVGGIKASPTGFQIYHQVGQNSSALYINESNNNGMPVYFISIIFKNNQQETLKVNMSLGGFEGLYKLKNYFDNFPVLSVLAANNANANQGGNSYQKSNNYQNGNSYGGGNNYQKSNNYQNGGNYQKSNNYQNGGNYQKSNNYQNGNSYGGGNNAQSSGYAPQNNNASQGGYAPQGNNAQSSGYAQSGNNAADMVN